MKKINGLIGCGLTVVLTWGALPLRAEPVDRAKAEEMARGWLAEGRTRLTAKLPEKVEASQTFGDFHVIQLAPEGYIVAAADDNLEPVVAFSSQGQFDTSPENPLWILLNSDLPGRASHVREIRGRHRNRNLIGGKPLSAAEEQVLRQADQSRAKWERFRNHPPKANQASRPKSSGASSVLPLQAGIQPNARSATEPVRIKDLRCVDGRIELIHDSQKSVSILVSRDEGRSWQVVDSGVFQSTWHSRWLTQDVDSIFRVEEDDVIDELTVEFMRHPTARSEIASEMVLPPIPNTNTDGLLNGTYVVTVSDVRVAPIVQSQWSQASAQGQNCYNLYTPNNYVCGCVATALSQLIRYWQYPISGIGQVTRTVYVDGSARTATTRGGNGAGGAYDWNSMPLIPAYASYNPTQWQMIGSLCYDTGVGVNMQYSSTGSGAYMIACADALSSIFRYASAKYVVQPWATATDLMKPINSNIEAGYPVLLGIDASGNSGHAIVCDGFGYASGTMYHHLNLGWAGSWDAWYTLPAIGGPYPWNNVHAVIFNVFPTGTGELISGRVTTAQGVAVQSATVIASQSGQNYTDTTDSKGYYGIKVPAGFSYNVTASAAGMASSTRTGVTVGTSTSPSYPPLCGNAVDVDFALNSFAFTAVALTNSVWLRWSAPTTCGMPNDTVYIRWRTDRHPTNASDGIEIYTGTAKVFEHIGVNSCGTVINYYSIWGNDGSPYANLGNSTKAQGSADMGRARLLWIGQGGEVQTWNLKLNGQIKSGVKAISSLVSPVNYWTVQGFNDVDRDGVADILWTGKSGEVLIWLLNADGTAKTARNVISGNLSPANYWSVGGFADIDRDGTPDILWTGAGGEVVYWLLNTNGVARVGGSVLSSNLSPLNYWTVRGFADIDKDGTADILWTGAGGEVVYWLLNANGTTKSGGSVSAGGMTPSNYWTVSGFADIDRDGTADILWTGAGGEVVFWLLNTNGTVKIRGNVSASSLSPAGYWKARGFADIDRDGTTDIIWHGGSGEVVCWLLNPSGIAKSGGAITPSLLSPSYWQLAGAANGIK